MATKKKFKICKTHVALIFIIAIIALFVFMMKPAAKTETEIPEIPTTPPTQPIACTADAKICPDGITSVGRNASRNCEFNDCPETPAAEQKTVSYTFPSGIAPPSLIVTSFLNTPTAPKVGDTVLLKFSVKNVGTDAPATTATVKVNGQTVATMDIPAIDRNAQKSLQAEWTATSAGDYTSIVDIAPVPGEKYFDDNTNTITFTVT